MEIANHQKAEILARALPYIQMYRKKVIVVKYGGNAMINEELKETVMNDLELLSTIGVPDRQPGRPRHRSVRAGRQYAKVQAGRRCPWLCG